MTPIFRISLGLLSLTTGLILLALSMGLLPNEYKLALETRSKIAENVTVLLASAMSRNDGVAIKETLGALVDRSADVLSIAIRAADNTLLFESGHHEFYWRGSTDGRSSETYVQVPLMSADVPQGRIEIAFKPVPGGATRLGLSRSQLAFVVFIGGAGFSGYYFILKRALRQLDPSHAIPERVKLAFDTLAEGVLIMDDHENIVLANDAFVDSIYAHPTSLIGTKASDLPWKSADGTNSMVDLPWRRSIREGAAILSTSMTVGTDQNNATHIIVNATPIRDGNGAIRGAIATFDDVSLLHRTNDELTRSIDQLHRSQIRIEEQNRQLEVLASSDPLTGCLNRRTFFARTESALQVSRRESTPLSMLMLDADHFKSINDRFGHATGDKVLVGLVDVMKRICDATALVGRYGGEEFCITVVGLESSRVQRLAEQIRQSIEAIDGWLPNSERVTVSIGIASCDSNCDVSDLVKRADSALYAAKAAGRNRFVSWTEISQSPVALTGQQSRPNDQDRPNSRSPYERDSSVPTAAA